LSYADFGFLGAGQKYAAESYVRDEYYKETEIIGFSCFVFLVFVVAISIIFVYFSFNPILLIKDIEAGCQTEIAKKLLRILAFFSPVVVFQRALHLIFSIRVEEYKIQKLIIIGNIIKIASVFLFFCGEIYDIVAYFLFIQIINLLVVIGGFFSAKRLYNFDIKAFVKAIYFNGRIFNQTKALAFSTLVTTITWVLYYEIDSFVIGKILGARQVAVYAIGFTILGFFRALLGSLFSPFGARFNHFIGLEKREQLVYFYKHIMVITFPFVVFPILAVELFSYPFILSWVGEKYLETINILRWLLLCNILAFISYPSGILLVALKKLKALYVVNILMPVVYWIGIFTTVSLFGVVSFAFFKFLIFLLSGIIYLYHSLAFLNISIIQFCKTCIFPYCPGIAVLITLSIICNKIFISNGNKLYLFYNCLIMFGCIVAALLCSYFIVRPLRNYTNRILMLIIKK
jgi:O-antigen/teichoic acid export membrane protein